MPMILVADDEEHTRIIVSRMLERAGYGVVTVADGTEVLSTAPTVQPDVILLDISMPILGGLQTAAALRADSQLCRVPLVAFTAHALYGDRERFLAAGFDAYLSKPFTYADLLQTVANLLSHPRLID